MRNTPHLERDEQEIEDHFEEYRPVKNSKKMKSQLVAAAKKHLKNKKSITLRVSVYDLEAIKIKASKSGIPYQTYINSLIHADAVRL